MSPWSAIALNPLADDGFFCRYDDFLAWSNANPDADETSSADRAVDFRAHLRGLGYGGVVIERCTRDGGLVRSDYAAFYPECVRILDVAPVVPSPVPAATPEELMARLRADAGLRSGPRR